MITEFTIAYHCNYVFLKTLDNIYKSQHQFYFLILETGITYYRLDAKHVFIHCGYYNLYGIGICPSEQK